MKKKAFISFDYDNDETVKRLLANQADFTDSPFQFSDFSVKNHLTGDWKEKVKIKIRNSDFVIVLCGEKTHTATGVAAELTIAKELNKKYFLLKGYPDKTCTKPTSATFFDVVNDWTWPNLKKLIG